MNSAKLIPSLQSEALAREIKRQMQDERNAVITAAEREAAAVIAESCNSARRRVREAIEELRRTRVFRLARAQAELETRQRALAQQRAAKAVSETLPLLRRELDACWSDPHRRRQWTDTVARLCTQRLRPGAWRVEHPLDWSALEQHEFIVTVGAREDVKICCSAERDLRSGLRIRSDQAVLDATPAGLLADGRTIAALILDEIEQGSATYLPTPEAGDE